MRRFWVFIGSAVYRNHRGVGTELLDGERRGNVENINIDVRSNEVHGGRGNINRVISVAPSLHAGKRGPQGLIGDARNIRSIRVNQHGRREYGGCNEEETQQ